MRKRFFTIFIFCNLLTLSMFAQVGINTTSPNNNSILDLDSNNKGLLIPRLTKAEMSALDATLTLTDAGMLVYCTELNLFCYYNGTDWISMPAWGQKVDLSDPTAEQNISPTIMNSNSGVGIGTTDPQSKFTVVGNLAVGKDSIAPTNGAYINGKVRMGVNAGIDNQLEVGGSINAKGKIKENGYDLVPAGTIVLWYGSTGSIPEGWAWCNGGTATWEAGGNFTTPDLSGRFVMGAGERQLIKRDSTGNFVSYDSDSTFSTGQRGGADKVELTRGEMPAHDHTTKEYSHRHGFNPDLDDEVFGNNCGDDDDEAIALGGEDTTPDSYSSPISGQWEDNDYFPVLKNKITYAFDQDTHNHDVHYKGSNNSHENRPPYYVLAYIIKL
ncbi:MAG: hypothetical protein JXR36_11390 [Bacteroidales bacterium]|nr:hypothetical protein [Bacteroidales bacterium]